MSVPCGVLIRIDTIDRDGEEKSVEELVVTLEEKTIDVRLNDNDATIVTLDLDEVKEAIKTLERWERDKSPGSDLWATRKEQRGNQRAFVA